MTGNAKSKIRKRLRSMLILTLLGTGIAVVALYRGKLKEQSLNRGFHTPPTRTPLVP
jgi:hypothetical protein